MKKNILFFIIFLISIHGNTQEQLSYTSKSGKVEFTVSPNEFYVEFESKDVSIVRTISKGNLRRINSNAVIVTQENLTGNFASRKKQLNNLFSNIFIA